jgi:Transcriptional regulators
MEMSLDALNGAGISPLGRETLTQGAVRLVRAAIVDGTLRPGSQLTVPAIAAACGVSATPAREALIHLEQAGLVSNDRGKIRIAGVSKQSLRDAFELREALEGMSARLAAERRSRDQLKQIERFAAQSLKAASSRDATVFKEADAAFHRSVADASQSQQLIRYEMNALDLAQTLRNIRRTGSSLKAGSAHYHVEVAEAIAASDGDLAETTMRRHIREVLDHLLTTGEPIED